MYYVYDSVYHKASYRMDDFQSMVRGRRTFALVEVQPPIFYHHAIAGGHRGFPPNSRSVPVHPFWLCSVHIWLSFCPGGTCNNILARSLFIITLTYTVCQHFLIKEQKQRCLLFGLESSFSVASARADLFFRKNRELYNHPLLEG